MRSTGVRRLVVDVEKKIELWAVEVLSIKAQTSQKAEQRRYGANAQAWGNALLRSALWFGGWWGPICQDFGWSIDAGLVRHM